MYRVTHNTLYRNSLRDIQSTAEAFARAQQQVSSGKRLQRASDDPAAAATGLRERAEIRRLRPRRDVGELAAAAPHDREPVLREHRRYVVSPAQVAGNVVGRVEHRHGARNTHSQADALASK